MNPKNTNRSHIWQVFLQQYPCSHLKLHKNTYHHHIGDGIFYSKLDGAFIINNSALVPKLSLIDQICPLKTPLYDSKHDVIAASFKMLTPLRPITPESSAPTVDLPTIRIKWVPDGIASYANSLAPVISQILSDWEPTPSIALFESLFIASNNLLLLHGTCSNKSFPIPPTP